MTPWTVAHQAPLSVGFSRQEYWSGLPFPPPGLEPRCPALQADSLPSEPPGKPKNTGVGSLSLLQGNLRDPGIKPGSPALQADASPAELPGDLWAPPFPQITLLTHSCLYSPHSGQLASDSSTGRICLTQLLCLPEMFLGVQGLTLAQC